MKTVFLVLSLLVALVATAQTDKYTAAMQKNLSLLGSAKTTEDLQSVAASFERIAEAEKTQWLPYYYAALAQTRIGFSDPKADKDKIGALLTSLLDKAEALENNADLCCLRNMTATIQMLVDPQNRWQTYGAAARAALEKGKQLDAKNPRLYYLEGMSIFGTPESFGGGRAKAKPLFQQSVELFKTAEVKPLYPDWGRKEAENMLAKCM